MTRKNYYFEVTYENGLKNKETNLTKTEAKALYDYHVKNSAVLNITYVRYGRNQAAIAA